MDAEKRKAFRQHLRYHFDFSKPTVAEEFSWRQVVKWGLVRYPFFGVAFWALSLSFDPSPVMAVLFGASAIVPSLLDAAIDERFDIPRGWEPLPIVLTTFPYMLTMLWFFETLGWMTVNW